MSQIITNVSAGRKFILPTGKVLVQGCSTKANAKILSDSHVKKLISSGRLSVSSVASTSDVISEIVDVAKEVVETISLSAINPIAAVANIPDVIKEIEDVVDIVVDSKPEEVKATRTRRATPKKEESDNG